MFSTPAYCYAAGDPHFQTFDGKRYSFQGICSYVLARDKDDGNFVIKAMNVLCGSTGVSCTKSLEITLYKQYKIHLVRGIEPRFNDAVMPNTALAAAAFSMYSAGMFTVISVPALELQVLWDKGMF